MDITNIKDNNIKEILACVAGSDGITRRDVSAKTGLSFSTVNTVCNALTEKGILISDKAAENAVGRTPALLKMRHDKYLTLCIDLQHKNTIGMAVIGFDNEVLHHSDFSSVGHNGIRELAALAKARFDWIKTDFEGATFLGVGISVSGIFDKNTGKMVGSAIPSMEGAPIKAVMEEIFGLPCYVDNESNLCAMSVLQNHPEMKDIIYLHVSQGVGVGVISDGNLLRGHRGYAAEIAHMPIGFHSDVRCPACGSYGCLEPELCVTALINAAAPELNAFDDSTAWTMLAERIAKAPGEYEQFLSEKGRLVGRALAALIDLFDPQAVFVGGELADILNYLREYIDDSVFKYCYLMRRQPLPIYGDCDSKTNILLGLNYAICEKWNPLS